jgi:hypothetical protein
LGQPDGMRGNAVRLARQFAVAISAPFLFRADGAAPASRKRRMLTDIFFSRGMEL